MSDACAALVERGDPDRFASAMTAPPAARARLWPLYAYNLEIARAPWAAREPLIAEMRLQWWIDALEEIAAGRPPRAHEVAAPLAAVIREAGVDPAPLIAMAEARRRDIGAEPFAGEAALAAYLEATAGGLMWAAAQALGAPPAAERAVRDAGFAAGLAAWFRAAPELIARGRRPLPDTDLTALADAGLHRLAAAMAARALIPAGAAPALRAGWRSAATLRRARAAPERIATGLAAEPEIARRFRLLALTLGGRW